MRNANTPEQPGENARSRTLQLRIIDINNGQVKVALTLPVGLVGVAQRLGAQLLPAATTIETVVMQAEQQGVANLAWADEAHAERLELRVE